MWDGVDGGGWVAGGGGGGGGGEGGGGVGEGSGGGGEGGGGGGGGGIPLHLQGWEAMQPPRWFEFNDIHRPLRQAFSSRKQAHWWPPLRSSPV